jgi:hypothetical protein
VISWRSSPAENGGDRFYGLHLQRRHRGFDQRHCLAIVVARSTTARPTRAPSSDNLNGTSGVVAFGVDHARHGPETTLRPTATAATQISVALLRKVTTGRDHRIPASCTSINGGTAGSLAAPPPPGRAALTNGKSYTCKVLATNAEQLRQSQPSTQWSCHRPDRARAAGRARQRASA